MRQIVNLTLVFIYLALQSCLRFDQYVFPSGEFPPELSCNGHPELCDRAYNEVAFPATHNSYNYEYGPTNFFFPNQDFDVAHQLEEGIRALMLDVYEEGGILTVYHGFIYTGNEPLSSPLNQIKKFLDVNPREIVSIIFESDLDGKSFSNAFTSAGLIDYVYSHESGGPWPTLEEMIESGKRLVVFTENESTAGSPAWFHYAWGNIFDTPYDFNSRSDFSCELNRGNIENDLFLVNHWITIPLIGIGNKDSASAVNTEAVLWERLQECIDFHKHIPNFVAVDFYRQGELIKIVNRINGIE